MQWPCIVINDVCGDDNARKRIETRIKWGITDSVCKSPTTVNIESDVDGYLNLVDQLDALRGRAAVFQINDAPRGTSKNEHSENGSPFGHIEWSGNHIFFTVDSRTMSLFQDLIGEDLPLAEVFDITPRLLTALKIEEYKWGQVAESQFRSFDLLPDLVQAYLTDVDLPCRTQPVPKLYGHFAFAATIDKFGNVKTSAVPNSFEHRPGQAWLVKFDGSDPLEVPCYPRLSNIPLGQPGAYIGSSGMWLGRVDLRHLEFAIQGGAFTDYALENHGVRITSGLPIEFLS